MEYPIIIHIPYNSTYIPESERDRILLSEAQLKKEFLFITDWYVNELFDTEKFEEYRGLVSRLVFDVERFREDKDEELSKFGRGAIYTKTVEGKDMRIIESNQREIMLNTYYDTYHEMFSEKIEKYLKKFGECLIINVHSFTSEPLDFEIDKSLPRPSFCIGTNEFHSTKGISQIAYDYFYWGESETVEYNKPFSGTFVPVQYNNIDSRVKSINISIKRSLYMNEETGLKLHTFQGVRRIMQNFVLTLGNFFISFDIK